MQTAPRKVKTGSKRQPRPWVSERNKQARAHILAQRKARRTTPDLRTMLVVRDMLAAWDAAQADAKAHLEVQQRAYRDAICTRNLTDDAPESIPEHSWRFIVRGLIPTEV
ncbi:hypothetical protein LGM54_30505 [Burkholderia cenocepacia]|uniref:hypothetical protein n=1 Tax=Burkholderia cenocepacia TaxID=95486 RepID=UPI001CF50ADA|nr:hypothetical protein [Burkholderia cenocepacia]MCA7967317.1 hypothetical protein [Burkholderia cenocepacia]